MMLVLFWLGILGISLGLLTRGSQWLLGSSEKIGKALHLSPFLIGAIIVAVGTSLPELMSSLFALYAGAPSIVAANVLGSNIANILFIVGISAITAGYLSLNGNIIDIDFPLLAITTALAAFVCIDGEISRPEAALLLLGGVLYITYALYNLHDEDNKVVPSKITTVDLLKLVVGTISLGIGAKYTIEAVLSLSTLTGVSTGAITLFAVAVGTSLPELVVSIQASLAKKTDILLGNIIGSNMFNALGIMGIAGVIMPLPLDTETLTWGIPMFIGATILFIISGFSRRINQWEGAFFLLLYTYFLLGIFGLV